MNRSTLLKLIIIVNIVLLGLLALVGAVAWGLIFAPEWLNGWVASLVGPEPKAYWYLSRASGVVGYVLLWLSVVLGLMITNRLAKVWPGGPSAVDLHEFTSLAGLAFASFHALVLLGDRYIGYSLGQLLIPFASTEYRPVWVGLGQVGLYLALPVTFSYYVRRVIGYRVWRLLHYGTFVVYLLITLHGLTAGTDTLHPAMLALYSGTALITAFLILYRLLAAIPDIRRVAS